MLNSAAESETKCKHKRTHKISRKLTYWRNKLKIRKIHAVFKISNLHLLTPFLEQQAHVFSRSLESERLLGVLYVIKVQPGKSLQGVTNLPGAGLLMGNVITHWFKKTKHCCAAADNNNTIHSINHDSKNIVPNNVIWFYVWFFNVSIYFLESHYNIKIYIQYHFNLKC